MKLNRTGSLWDRNQRNDINENWQIIEGDYKNIVDNVSNKAYQQVVDNAKLNWKEPVNSYSNLPSSATKGDTRMTRDTGKVYRFSGSTWQEIQQIDAGPVNELDSRVSAQLAETDDEVKKKANKGKLYGYKYQAVIRSTTPNIIGMDREHYIFRNNSGVLERSIDNEIWETVYNFNRSVIGVRQLDNGELLVSTGHNYPANTIKGKIHLSTGYLTEDVHFDEVLEASDYEINIGLTWGFGGSGSTYTVSEYDGKPLNQRSPNQRVWLTENYGNTWREVYNHGTGSLSSGHIHGTTYDVYRDAIWVTHGDGEGFSGIRVSWDKGVSWQVVSERHQPTSVYVFPDAVIFGSDNAPNGILRIDNPSPDNLNYKFVYAVSDRELISHVAQSPFRLGNGYPLLIPFSPTTSVNPGVVVGTYDGYTYFDVWVDKRTPSPSQNTTHAIGPLKDGSFILSGSDSSGEYKVVIDSIEQSLVSAISRNAEHHQRIMPRRSYIRIGNVSNPFQTLQPNTWTVIELKTTVFNLNRNDVTDLFSVESDGVVFNRKCIVRVESQIPVQWSTINPRTRVRVYNANGTNIATLGNHATPDISRTITVDKGHKIVVQGNHSTETEQILQGTEYALVLESWEIG